MKKLRPTYYYLLLMITLICSSCAHQCCPDGSCGHHKKEHKEGCFGRNGDNCNEKATLAPENTEEMKNSQTSCEK